MCETVFQVSVGAEWCRTCDLSSSEIEENDCPYIDGHVLVPPEI